MSSSVASSTIALARVGPSNEERAESEPEDAGLDGRDGWIIVVAISALLFIAIGQSYSFGLLQAQLLSEGVGPASSLSFVGSTSVACLAFFAIPNARLLRLIGSRKMMMLGVILLSLGQVLAGFTTHHIGGLFVTAGLIAGAGNSLCFTVATVVPSQYFRRRRGLALGIIFAAGGIGGAVMSLVIGKLLSAVGTAWTFRTLGFLTFGVTFPATFFVQDRVRLDRSMPLVQWSLFKDLRFVCILLAGAVGTLPLFVAPFWLPAYSLTLGYSSSTAAALVAGFNVCSGLGRLGFGALCDYAGPLNALIGATFLSGVSFLALWPISNSLAPLVVFVVCNAAGNGGFFSCMPVCVSSMFSYAPVSVAMGMVVTTWAGGYLMGPPIAGFLVEHGGQTAGLAAYRPAMWYAGSLALASTFFAVLAKSSCAARSSKASRGSS